MRIKTSHTYVEGDNQDRFQRVWSPVTSGPAIWYTTDHAGTRVVRRCTTKEANELEKQFKAIESPNN